MHIVSLHASLVIFSKKNAGVTAVVAVVRAHTHCHVFAGCYAWLAVDYGCTCVLMYYLCCHSGRAVVLLGNKTASALLLASEVVLI